MKISMWFFLFFSITSVVYSQNNITNTLGTGGLFSIKDASTTFLTLDQINGYLNLTSGVIFKGADRFIHAYYGSGGGNTFVGLNSGNFTMQGGVAEASYNTGVGNGSLTSLTTGYQNCGFGATSLYATTTGNNNSAFGYNALRINTTGDYNSSFGASSMYSNTSGQGNSAFGIATLSANTTGSNNSAFGGDALYSNRTGENNSALGNFSLISNTIGRENTAVGYKTLYTNVSGFQNTAVGDSALYYNTGNYNTALGYNAGSNVTTGANLTLIGIDANPSSPTTFDEITLGNIYVTTLRCNTQSITSLSDARDKKNISELSLGLDFISMLKPR